jgi:hypothetical protein
VEMGTEISDDGKTKWRNNGGIIERRAQGHQWEIVAETEHTPHTAEELKAFCISGGFGYETPRETIDT